MSIGQLPQSHRGYVGLAKESAFDDGTSPSIYVDAVSEGFALDNQTNYQNTTRSRAAHKAEAGPLSVEGSVDAPASPEGGLGLILLAALGSESFTALDPDSDSTDEVGEHVFSPADTLPSLSAEVERDGNPLRVGGVGVNNFSLSHTAEEALSWSADLIGATPDPSVSAATPTYSDLRNFWFQDAAASFGGTSRIADLRDLEFSIENNLGANWRSSRTVEKMETGERSIGFTGTLDFEDSGLFDTFFSGGTPVDELPTIAVSATWTSPETIADTSTGYELDINAPTVAVNTHDANLNQNESIAENVEMRAIYDSGIGSEVEVTLTNGVTSAY